MSSVKILVCCHKKTSWLKDDIFTPILLGSYFADDSLKEQFRDQLWDCFGENIGKLHPYAAELTAVYWAWKNYRELGNPDYIGLFHYRRFLNFMEDIPEEDLWKCSFFDFESSTRCRFGWEVDIIQSFCDGTDMILPYKEMILDPYDWKTPATLETHYKHSHYPEDFDKAYSFIKNNFPDYASAVEQTARSDSGYFCNMFIMTREKFFDYAQWLFDIILPLSKLLPITDKKYVNETQKRVLGFLGERLFNVWITKQTIDGIKIKETQRLTGYLSLQDQKTYIKRYGKEEYNTALFRSKKVVGIKDSIFGGDNDDLIVHPSRLNWQPKVSILVPVYNVSEFLRECVDSLIHQSLEEIEMIFVNNASTDNSLNILMEYYNKDPRIVIIEHKKNRGLPSSRNTALRFTRGVSFGYVDSDDICDLKMFEKMYKKAESLQADIVTCCVMGFYDTLESKYFHRQLEWYGDTDRVLPLSARPQQLMEPAAWCKLFRTSYVRNLDYFEFRPNTLSWEDVPAMTSAFIQTDRIATVQEALYFYRQRSDGNLSNSMTRRNINEFISGIQMQQIIISKHQYNNEEVRSYIEEFKLLYAEWMLTKMVKKDIPYFFHHVPGLFNYKDRRYLKRAFNFYPNRKRFYFVMMTRSSILYYVGKFTFRAGRRIKHCIKQAFGVKREDIYWTFHIGPFRFRKFCKPYYDQTITWFEERVQTANGKIANLNGQLLDLKDSNTVLANKNNALLIENQDLQIERINQVRAEKELIDKIDTLHSYNEKLLKNSEILASTNRELLEKTETLTISNNSLTIANRALQNAGETLRLANRSLETINERQNKDYQAVIENRTELYIVCEKQKKEIASLNDIVERFKQEFDGFYHAVWNTGWVNLWKEFYCKNYGVIKSKLEKLKINLDTESIAVIDRQCYRMFRLLPMQEDADLFRYDHSHIYTPEELKGANIPIDEAYFRSRFVIPENEHLETSVFRFHCGLSELPVEVSQQISGMDVIDGGAFWGDSALVFSEYAPKRIFAFEPQPKTFSVLMDTIRSNNMENFVIPVRSGLGEKSESKLLYTSRMASGANLAGIIPVISDNAMQVDQVQITSIDEFCLNREIKVGLIKLDIEGNELSAIQGALQVICRDTPLLAISIYHTPVDFFEIKPLLESLNLGYKFIVRKLVYHDLVSEIMLLGYVDKLGGM